jgi:hypothetical protein
MSQSTHSPRVNRFSWGRVEVEGYDRPFKDVKLFPGSARAWDWNETGTRHDPGIQPADVQELLDHGATTIILSKGVQERLGVCNETLAMLAARNITAIVLQTEAAIERYNQLCEHEAVGALIHSTC